MAGESSRSLSDTGAACDIQLRRNVKNFQGWGFRVYAAYYRIFWAGFRVEVLSQEIGWRVVVTNLGLGHEVPQQIWETA